MDRSKRRNYLKILYHNIPKNWQAMSYFFLTSDCCCCCCCCCCWYLAHTGSRCRRAYILPLCFFCLFSTHNLWVHRTDLNETWINIHLWLLFEKFGPNSPGHLPPLGEWGKKIYFLADFEFRPNISLQWNMISTIGKNYKSTKTPLHALQIWWTLAQKRLRTVGEFLPTPKYACRPTLYNRQQANLARTYSLEQQNAGGHTQSFAILLVCW